MLKKLQEIKVLIWDFDGTLYKPIPALWQEIREAEYKLIEISRKVGREEAVRLFRDNYKKVSPSATETVAYLTGLTTAQAAIQFENYFDRCKYLRRDQKLIDMFEQLRRFRHFILGNGVMEKLVRTLAVLGVPVETFTEIVTSETVGVNKPNEAGFRHILDKTKVPPAAHLMIGDREAVDIEPAKKLGMHTCLVWSKEISMVADITLPTVYDVERVLL